MNAPVAPLKIGQVHALLRQDHPNLELSKIRYYEEMGLVAPARSRKGYRLYTEKDVACLREAIRLADEEFVPLRVIRVRLIEHGLLKGDHQAPSSSPRRVARSAQAKVISMPVRTSSTSPVARAESDTGSLDNDAASVGQPGGRLSANDVLAASGVEPELMNKILSLGLVTPVVHDGHNTYGPLDVDIVLASADLLRGGADARLLGALRRVVERQIGILDDLTADVRGSSTSASEVASVKRDVASDLELLRARLFERALDDFIAPQ